MKNPLHLAFLSAGYLLAAAVGTLIYLESRPPVAESKFRSLELGMERGAVLNLLGPPTYISHLTNDAGLDVGEEWTYERNRLLSSAWAYVTLTNGSVSRIGRDSFP
jgi:hypothetical protein